LSPRRRPDPGPRLWRSGVYYFDEVIGFRPRRLRVRYSLGTKDPRLARRLWEREVRRQWSIYYGEEIKAPITPARMDDLIPEYIEFKRDVRRASTWKTYEARLNIVSRAWGNPMLRDVAAADVKKLESYFMAQTDKGGRKRGEVTINHYVRFVREFFGWAIDRGYLSGPNPMRSVRPYPVSPSRRAYTRDEMRRIAEAAGRIADDARPQDEIMRQARRLVLLLYYTGMRLGEVLNLRWGDIQDETIRLAAGMTKQRRSKIVPVTPPIAAVLRELEAERRDDYVLPLRRRSGGVYRSDWANGLLLRIRAESGVKDFLFHGLRHTASTLMAARIGRGATLRDVMAVLGHSRTETTLGYQHEARERMATALASIPEIGYTPGVERADKRRKPRDLEAKPTRRKAQAADNKRD